MPKRTNEFQKLIKKIYNTIGNIEGGKVTESALLKDKNGIEREVDILVEASSFGHCIRIAIECRDRVRKDDIQWIDSIIGKFQDIDVDKKIAVSRKGFSEGAKQRAKSFGIETMTLKDCEEINWPETLEKLKVGEFRITFNAKSVSMILCPDPQNSVQQNWLAYNREGKPLGMVSNILKECLDDYVNKKVHDYINKEYIPSIRVIDDLRRDLEITVPVDIEDIIIESMDGRRFELKKLIYLIAGKAVLEECDVRRFMFGEKAFVSRACIEAEGIRHKIEIVQIKGSPTVSTSHDQEKI